MSADLAPVLRDLLARADDLISAIDGSSDMFEPEVAALTAACTAAEAALPKEKHAEAAAPEQVEACQYAAPYQGRCGVAVEANHRFCEKHTGVACISCKQQADHECSYTGQFVCGFPLCPQCEGYEERDQPSGAWGFLNHRHRRRAEIGGAS